MGRPEPPVGAPRRHGRGNGRIAKDKRQRAEGRGPRTGGRDPRAAWEGGPQRSARGFVRAPAVRPSAVTSPAWATRQSYRGCLKPPERGRPTWDMTTVTNIRTEPASVRWQSWRGPSGTVAGFR